MPSQKKLQECLAEFRKVWLSFTRLEGRVLDRSRMRPEEERDFLEMKDAVLARFERLRTDLEPEVPEALGRSIGTLTGLRGLGSLADPELETVRGAIRTVDRELEEWAERLERRHRLRDHFRESARRDAIPVVAVPFFFALLVALFVAVGMKFFLNR